MTFQVKDSITVNETLAINSSGQVVTPLAVSSTSTSSITNTNGAGGTTFSITGTPYLPVGNQTWAFKTGTSLGAPASWMSWPDGSLQQTAYLGTATTSQIGGVQPDGTTITISSGTISVPTATTSALGLVKPDGSSITISGGVISTSVGVATSLIKYTRTTQQTSGISGGSIIICGVLELTQGSDISYNTTTGKATLAANRTYRLRGAVPTFTGTAGALGYCWYNETSSAYIGEMAGQYSPTSGAAYGGMGGTAEAVITVGSSAITVSFRVTNSSNVSALGGNGDFTTTGSYPWIEIEVVAGNATITALTPPTVTTSTATNSTSTSTGSIISAGGLGVALDTNLGGTLTVGKNVSVTYNPGSTTGAAIFATGSGTAGGTSYFDFLRATNSYSSATNPTKTFRLDSSGTFQILNNAYNATVFSVTDAGFIAINGSSSATNGVPINNGIAMNSNSYIFDDGNYHITSKTGSIWLNANDGSTVNINTQMPNGITGAGMNVQGAVQSYATGGTAFISGSGAVSAVALQMADRSALRNIVNGASTMYFDVSTGGTTNGDFQFRSSSSYTNYLTINSSGLTSRTPSLGKLAWNSAAATELTIDNYRFRVQSSGSPTAQIISNTGGTVNSAWTAVASISGSAISQTGSTGTLVPNGSWTNLYGSNLGASGDNITVTLQDKSAGRIYRVTFMRSDDGSTTGYNIIAERLL